MLITFIYAATNRIFLFLFIADEKNADKSITVDTANKQCHIKVLAIPLPKSITDLLEANHELLKSVANTTNISERIETRLKELRNSMNDAFAECKENPEIYHKNNLLEKIWLFGPKKCGTNILLNLTDFKHQSVWNFGKTKSTPDESVRDIRSDLENSFLNGFQLATIAGPLCEEPMHGVCFIVEKWIVNETDETNMSIGSLAGKHIHFLFLFLRNKFRFLIIKRFYRSIDICNKRCTAKSISKSTTTFGHTNV